MADTDALSDQFFNLCQTTYDYLNDDDEDIRETAAVVACRILQADSERTYTDLVPMLATEYLASFICRRWPQKPETAGSAVLRAYGITQNHNRSVQDLVADYTKEDTTLFAEEKQNLYIDEARETMVWTQALLRLSPQAFSKPLLQALSQWTVDGLRTLKDRCSNDVDGPLGWSSNAEVFNLGLRVVFAARILLHLQDIRVKVPVKGSDVRRQLEELTVADEVNEMHPLWFRAIHRTLEQSVLARLGRVHRVLDKAGRQLASAQVRV